MALDKILGFFADNKEVTQLIAKSVPTIMGFHQANKAKGAIEDYQLKLDDIEKSRQQIVNPYANVTNPFANMQVATKAAEMQAEQADISLANTLDNLRETGASAGGATALAQAALRSKQGISADIQKQETQNQKLAAQGQQRMEMAKAQGEQARFNMQENRDVRDTNRLQMQMDLAQQQRAVGLATGAAALASGIGGLSTFIKPEDKIGNVVGGVEGGTEGPFNFDYNSLNPYGSYTAAQFQNPNATGAWGQNLTGMVNERNSLNPSDPNYQVNLDNINRLITDTRKKLGLNKTNQ